MFGWQLAQAGIKQWVIQGAQVPSRAPATPACDCMGNSELQTVPAQSICSSCPYSGVWCTQEFRCDISSWSMKLPRKSHCAAPLLILVGFPSWVEHLGVCHVVVLFGGVLLPGRAASEHRTTHQCPSWSWHSAYWVSSSFRFTVLVGSLISQQQWKRFDFMIDFPQMTLTVVDGQFLLASLCYFSQTS